MVQITLTDAQVQVVLDATDTPEPIKPPDHDGDSTVHTFSHFFGVSFGTGYISKGSNAMPIPMNASKVTFTFDILPEHVGKKLFMSERYSGSGAKTARFSVYGIKYSQKNVGTGSLVNIKITAAMVGVAAMIEYWQQEPVSKAFKTALETGLR